MVGGGGGFIVSEDEQPLATTTGFMRDWRTEQSSAVWAAGAAAGQSEVGAGKAGSQRL